MAFLLLIPAALGLGIGCGAFILLALIPWQRPRTLGAALWIAVFGIALSVTFWIEIIALGLLSGRSVQRLVRIDELYLHHPRLIFASILIASAFLATVAMLLHGVVIRRITFRLFRLYASAVACGVGILSSVFITWILAANTDLAHPWASLAIAIILLPPLLTFIVYRHPNDFRGARPERLNLVTSEEYSSAP